jgi:hypothetical protein
LYGGIKIVPIHMENREMTIKTRVMKTTGLRMEEGVIWNLASAAVED